MRINELNVGKDSPLYRHVNSLKFIFNNIEIETNNLITTSSEEISAENSILITHIRNITNEIYSACEIINEMFIDYFRNDDRYRGSQLKNGFNSNFKKIYDAVINHKRELTGVYLNEHLKSFYYSAKDWYIDVHDIRTQETHYEVGRIEYYEDIIYYVNGNRNGVSKSLYTNPLSETRILITKIIELSNMFLETQNVLCDMIQM